MTDLAMLRAKRQRTARHLKSVWELEEASDSFISRLSLSSDEEKELSKQNYEFEQYLEGCLEDSIEEYSALVYGYEGKKQEEKDLKKAEEQWVT